MQKSNISGRKDRGGKQSAYEVSFMVKVASFYSESQESLSQVAERFKITRSLVNNWHRRFNLQKGEPNTPVQVMTEQEQKELEALKKQNEELAKKLSYSNLQVLGLQTMIDIAEKELKIDIRKKSGTKQLDK
jgi:transposase-like protein